MITLIIVKVANFNEVNLNTFIHATIMHIQIMSLIKILLLLKYQAINKPAPTIKLNNYNILNLKVLTLNNVIIRILNLKRNRISFTQIPTPKMPRTKLKTVKIIVITS